MEENSECKHCKTLHEEMYWKHFNSTHFCQTLTTSFCDHLVLPKKFSSHMRNLLPDKVSLKGPSGALWEIDLRKADDLVFCGNDWVDFVKANDLKENCLLVFKYKRNSSFEVLIFDSPTSCEKEATYFVKKCTHTTTDHEVQRKRKAIETSNTEIIEDDAEDDSAFVASKKSRKDKEALVGLGGKVNAQTPKKRVLYARAKGRGGATRALQTRKLPRKISIRNETADEPSEIVERDVITPENEESSPGINRSHGSKPQSKRSLNGDVAEKDQNQNSRKEPTIPENGKNSAAGDQSNALKGQSEKRPTSIGPSKEPNQVVEELYAPEKEKYPSSDKEPTESAIAKVLTRASGREAIKPNYRESSLEQDHSHTSCGKRGRSKKQRLPQSAEKLVFESVSGARSLSRGYIRPTEDEKEYALQRAIKNKTENSFIAIMRPTSVYRRFFMNIPAEWLQKNHLRKNQEIVLRVGEKTWLVKFSDYGQRSSGICIGWKTFALENSLEEFDVLVFKPVSERDAAIVVMDVDIYRVARPLLLASP